MTPRRFLAVAAMLTLGLAACGDDGDDEAGAHSDAAHGGDGECSPAGEDLAPTASPTISLELKDYAFSPAALDARAGIVTFTATNAGSEHHELAFLPGGGNVPVGDKGEPDEAALEEAGAFELEAFAPGKTCSATFEVAPGTYTLFCIVTADDGKTHYDKGMRGELVVA